MFRRLTTIGKKTKPENLKLTRNMSAEQEPPVKKQKPNYNFRKDEDYTRLEDKNPNLKKRKVAMIFGYAGTGYSGLQYNGVHKTIEKEIWENLILFHFHKYLIWFTSSFE